MLGGEIPYRDFFVEYPPGALPAFVLPALGPSDDYVLLFKLLQIGFGAAAVAFVALTLALLGVTRRRLYLATAFTALAPLALGPTVLNRYDLWPAALLAGALAALVAGRTTIGLGVLGAAVIAKGYALAAVPPALLYVSARGGRNELKRGTIAFFGTILVIAAPFLVTRSRRPASRLQDPDGPRAPYREPRRLGPHRGRPARAVQRGRGQRLRVRAPRLAAGRGRDAGDARPACRDRRRVDPLPARPGNRATPRRRRSGGVTAFAAFGKVLSPQFLIWLVPLVPLASGLVAPALLLAALGLTQAFFPSRYRGVVDIGRRDLARARAQPGARRPLRRPRSAAAGSARVEDEAVRPRSARSRRPMSRGRARRSAGVPATKTRAGR